MENGTEFISTVQEAIEDLKNGKFIIVMDDLDRENEGDLIMAAEFANPEKLAFSVNHTTGILCAPMTHERAVKLRLPQMVYNGNDPNKTAFTITVDHIDSSTGVSAEDRAKTFVNLANPAIKAENFRRPGHVFPLVAVSGGITERKGHTEATIDLLQLANLTPVGLIGELVNKDGSMKRLVDCISFAKRNNLKIITIDQMLKMKSFNSLNLTNRNFMNVELLAKCNLPINLNQVDLGIWKLKCYFSYIDGLRHVALEYGTNSFKENAILARVQSECFTGDIFGSQRCDCGEQLFKSLKMIKHVGAGVLIYYMGHEGRGIGLSNKIKAYQLQQQKNLDTFEANNKLGFADDLRTYLSAKAILKTMGITKIRLITNNKLKVEAFAEMVDEIIDLKITPNSHNSLYLKSKALKQGVAPFKKILNGHSNLIINQSIKCGPQLPKQSINTKELKIGIVYTSWNHILLNPFKITIKQNLIDENIDESNVIELLVPGSFEAAKWLTTKCDSILCIGLLIKGETMHFEMISHSVAQALMKLQISSDVPVINGILNCYTEEQAKTRCGEGSHLAESLAATAIHMANLRKAWKT